MEVTKEGAPSKGRRWVRALLALGGVALLALQGAHGRSVKKAGLAEVGYAGCVEVLRTGPVCQFWWKGERRLRLHPPREAQDIQVRIDGKSAPASRTRRKEGVFLAVDIPLHASRVEVRWRVGREERAWSLALADAQPSPDWILEAFRRSQESKGLDLAIRTLDNGLRKATRGHRAEAESMRARFICSVSGGDQARCIEALFRAVDSQRKAGLVLGEAYEVGALFYYLIQAGRYVDACRQLEESGVQAGAPAEALSWMAFNRGLLARKVRDHRTALAELEYSSTLADQFVLGGSVRNNAEQVRALELGQLGRFAEADTIFSDLLARTLTEADGASPCERAELLNNQGWVRYLSGEAGLHLAEATPLFREAGDLYAANSCRNSQDTRFNTAINLALAALQRHPPALREADRALASAGLFLAGAIPSHRIWLYYLQAQLALEKGRPYEALLLFTRYGDLAHALLLGEEWWQAEFGKAQAHEKLGRLATSVSILTAADTFVDRQLVSIPLAAGRETFVDRWEKGARFLVDLLLRLGRTEEGFLAARRARVLTLRHLALDQRLESLSPEERFRREREMGRYWRLRDELDLQSAQDWLLDPAKVRQAGDRRWALYGPSLKVLDRAFSKGASQAWRGEWRTPPRDRRELTLAYFPLPAVDSWVAFADDGSAVVAQRFQLPPAAADDTAARERLSRLLLEPFHRQILRAERVRILPYGALRRIPFHALPFAGDILLAAKPVAYGLDIQVPKVSSGREALRALIVADPQDNLAHARREGAETGALLRGSGADWQIATLTGSEEASKEAVVESLRSGLDLLHYAGHADFAGIGGWGSHLPLARGTSLTSGDLLALGLAPRWVVLSGCESGKTDPSVQLETLSLAHAFLLAGSQGVVAATEDVLDTASRQLMRELYRPVHGRSLDFAVLLQKAQLAMRARDPKGHWESFQVFVP